MRLDLDFFLQLQGKMHRIFGVTPLQNCINLLGNNHFSHPYHYDASILILGTTGIIFMFISSCDKIHVSKQNSPRWDAAFCGVTSGLCPVKRTSGLKGLSKYDSGNSKMVNTKMDRRNKPRHYQHRKHSQYIS